MYARQVTACGITGQLVDATTGAHVWANRFDGALDDIFDLQDQVTASVVGAIEPRLQQARDRARGAKADREPGCLRLLLAGWPASISSRETASWKQSDFSSARRSSMPTTPLLTGSRHGAFALASQTAGCLILSALGPLRGVRLARRAVAVGKDDPTALWSGGINLAYLAAELETGAAYIDRAIVLNPKQRQRGARAVGCASILESRRPRLSV